MTESEDLAAAAAGRIITALDALPPHIRSGACWDLLTDDSLTLVGIAEAMRGDPKDRQSALARSLLGDVLIGDLEPIAGRLADDTEPWATIRAALLDVLAAWRADHPGWRTAFDRRASE